MRKPSPPAVTQSGNAILPIFLRAIRLSSHPVACSSAHPHLHPVYSTHSSSFSANACEAANGIRRRMTKSRLISWQNGSQGRKRKPGKSIIALLFTHAKHTLGKSPGGPNLLWVEYASPAPIHASSSFLFRSRALAMGDGNYALAL